MLQREPEAQRGQRPLLARRPAATGGCAARRRTLRRRWRRPTRGSPGAARRRRRALPAPRSPAEAIALGGILGHRALDDVVEAGWQVRASRDGDGGGSLTCASIAFSPPCPAYGRLAGEASKSRQPSAYTSVRASTRSSRICSGATYSARATIEPWRVSPPASRRLLGETEVAEVDVVASREQHVGRLDVAVHQVARVGGVQRGPDLADDARGAGRLHAPSAASRARRSVPSTSRIVM